MSLRSEELSKADLERVALELARGNGDRIVWSACFAVSSPVAALSIKADFVAAGAVGAYADGWSGRVVVEFDGSLVRQIAWVAVRHDAELRGDSRTWPKAR